MSADEFAMGICQLGTITPVGLDGADIYLLLADGTATRNPVVVQSIFGAAARGIPIFIASAREDPAPPWMLRMARLVVWASRATPRVEIGRALAVAARNWMGDRRRVKAWTN